MLVKSKLLLEKNTKLECVKIFEKDALFTDIRVLRSSVPPELHLYELRDACDGDPCQVKSGVMVNFFGSILTKEPIPDADTGVEIVWHDVKEGDRTYRETDDFYYTGEYTTLEEFISKKE